MAHDRAKFIIGGFGLIFDEQGRILLVHRTDYDLWNLPGGLIESGETPWQGAIREIKEETGFDAEMIKLIGISSKPEKDDVVFTFLCKITGGEKTFSDESDRIEYFEIDKIPKNTVIRQVERIKDYLQHPDEVFLKTLTGKSTIELIKEGKFNV